MLRHTWHSIMASTMSLQAPGTIRSAFRPSKSAVVCSRPTLTSCKVHAVRLPAQKAYLGGTKFLSSTLSRSARHRACLGATCSGADHPASPGDDLNNHSECSTSPVVLRFLHACSACRREEGEPTDIGVAVHGLVWVQYLLQYVSLRLQYAHIHAMQRV